MSSVKIVGTAHVSVAFGVAVLVECLCRSTGIVYICNTLFDSSIFWDIWFYCWLCASLYWARSVSYVRRVARRFRKHVFVPIESRWSREGFKNMKSFDFLCYIVHERSEHSGSDLSQFHISLSLSLSFSLFLSLFLCAIVWMEMRKETMTRWLRVWIETR